MPITEVFPNPTVKHVCFEMRFPSLFYIEGRIGEYQLTIMTRFPESRLLHQRNIVIAEVGPDVKLDQVGDQNNPPGLTRIWNFKSPNGFEMNVKNDSLWVASTLHKTYNNVKSADRFRDIIQFAVDNFLRTVQVPVLTRIGLRYTDECPVPDRDAASFKASYNTALPIERFPLADCHKLEFVARTRRGKHGLVFRECLDFQGTPKLILDFDAYATGVPSASYLATTDELHDLCAAEYEAAIKEPVFEFMRKPKENPN